MILEQLIVGTMDVCCYVVGCEKTGKGAVIDPGGDEDKILASVKKHGLDLEYILLTHGHPDHVCGNRKLKEATGAKIVMHTDEAAFLAKPGIAEYFSMLGLEPSPPADILIKEGDIVSVGEEKFKVIHTPGHTPGGICLYNAPNLFTGDTLFAGGIGRTDFPGGSTEQLLTAIRSKLFVLPAETVVWPGHGYGGCHSTIGIEAKSNPFL
ncbi:MBL fold metallo-hydrolase [Desulforhopalus vacuolatus]|uniref:MBL fold metallo-hydrolase n=1 Tax=Desulforhopalus vacuolatus TaxID=40414 RepID=UPI0019653E64|nr:MBL fold metallo-hydrolase [Desulforhopalus vacuolatus]MBM9519633.1 MBL fold metallo-hydrolase [Desulforhopalus vacuolatus]